MGGWWEWFCTWAGYAIAYLVGGTLPATCRWVARWVRLMPRPKFDRVQHWKGPDDDQWLRAHVSLKKCRFVGNDHYSKCTFDVALENGGGNAVPLLVAGTP